MIAVAELRVRPGDPRDTSLPLVRHRYRWALLVTAAVAVGGLAWFALGDDERQRFCADVGLITQPSGSTPNNAMSAWVRSRGGDPDDWAAGGERLEHAYHARTAVAAPQRGTWRSRYGRSARVSGVSIARA
jgi:hypothetical protein